MKDVGAYLEGLPGGAVGALHAAAEASHASPGA